MPTGIPIVWTKEQIEDIKSEFNNRKSFLKIANKYNVSEPVICRLIKSLNLGSRGNVKQRVFSEIELNDIKHRYLNTSELFTSICKSYDICQVTLLKILRENNIKTRENRKPAIVDESYFETVNTPNKAYFLGFLAADGYIKDRVKHGQKLLCMSLQERDAYILDRFKKEIKFEGNVRIRPKRNEKWQATGEISIKSDKLCNDIGLLGVTPRKSFTYQFPTFNQVPEHLILHFIRGLFDGDGCITEGFYKNKTPFYRFFIVGNESTCNGVRNILYGKYGLGSGEVCKRVHKDHRKPIYNYYVTGKYNVQKLYKLLYNDAEMFLIRKKDKFKKVFD